jgi:hypothetical protein
MNTQRFTLEIVKEKLSKINPNIDIISDEYINSRTKLKCKCKIDGNIWFTSWDILNKGRGCPICGRKSSSEKQIMSIEELRNRVKLISPNIEILSISNKSME